VVPPPDSVPVPGRISGGARGVLYLDPACHATAAVRQIAALRDDTLKTQLAGVLVDCRTVTFDVFGEPHPRVPREQLSEVGIALPVTGSQKGQPDRCAPSGDFLCGTVHWIIAGSIPPKTPKWRKFRTKSPFCAHYRPPTTGSEFFW
jgi:hypothetical protein